MKTCSYHSCPDPSHTSGQYQSQPQPQVIYVEPREDKGNDAGLCATAWSVFFLHLYPPLTDDHPPVALVFARAVSALAVAAAKVVYTLWEICCNVLVRSLFVSTFSVPTRPGTITLRLCFCEVNHEHEEESMGFTVNKRSSQHRSNPSRTLSAPTPTAQTRGTAFYLVLGKHPCSAVGGRCPGSRSVTPHRAVLVSPMPHMMHGFKHV